MSSNTNDNGDDVFVNLRSQDNKTLIEISNSTNTTNRCIRSFAYWNPELLKSKQLLNAQNGELIEIDFSHIGKDTLNLNNQDIESEHYRILGKNIEIDLWYSNDKHWLALQSKTEDGYLLRYELQTEVGK